VRFILFALSALTLVACGSPTTPTQQPPLVATHILTVTLAPTCGASPSSSFSMFDLSVSGRLNPAGRSTFVAVPPLDLNCNPSQLDLLLDVNGPAATGTIGGQQCFVTGGVYDVAFNRIGVPPQPPGLLQGEVREDQRGRLEIVNGVLNGTVNIGLKFSAFGFECTAVDHKWSLRPL
jgi:hypothetical protein